ncbi:LysR family transcriptional regulator [Utexia brackfieldae]|uniref:LysR family transcriptional regulator n=1 Tax=Utexia brackfieldae TaxID=3074108 RepID=UPI00370DB128
MLNRLDALKYFCIAAETLQFRETAVRMSVSPQVVTRMIAELEEELGTLLFVRNTRNMQLTEFGERFLPQAQQYLLNGEKLFATAKQKQSAMSGIVRITVPRLPENDAILADLAERCADYPELRIDWRVDAAKLHLVGNQIDIGLRIGFEPDPLMIIRKIVEMQDKFVISPLLLAKLGPPEDLEDLQKRFPVSNLINVDTGRSWGWPLNDELHLFPKQLRFSTDDPYSELSAALSGMTCSLIADYMCNEHIESGRLMELFSDIPRKCWQMYLYRPQRTMTSTHVLKVFDWLTEILLRYYKK